MKKTIIKTSIKDNVSIEVSESVQEVFDGLMTKGNFILLNRTNYKKETSKLVLRKSSVKMVKEQ